MAFKVLNTLKEIPEYGCNPKHKCYDESSLIVNNNIFIDYINHVILAGLTPEEYFEENLLHETMHFWRIGGADPIREGLTELKTSKLAKRRCLKTSGCGYPKEIEVVLRPQEILGADIINKIAFSKGNDHISWLLTNEYGSEIKNLYFQF